MQGAVIIDADGRRYMLKDAMRQGAQAEVWTAVPEEAGRLAVVVKFARGPEEGRAIERSVMLSAVLHSGWMRPLAVGQHEGRPFAVFELAVGGDLLSLVLSDGPLKPRQAAQWAAELAEVVSSAHAVGICHRDIKPDNVVLTPRGPRLIDLGVGLARGDRDETGPGRALGWAAPECLTAGTDYPCAFADLYGLGGLLFWMLTARSPNGDTPDEARARLLPAAAEVTRRIRQDHLKSAGVPRSLADLTLRCLDHDPARRPLQASALAADLRAWLAGEVPATTPRAQWLRRARKAAPLAAMLTLGGLLGWLLTAAIAGERIRDAYADATRQGTRMIEEAAMVEAEAADTLSEVNALRERLTEHSAIIDTRLRAQISARRFDPARYGSVKNTPTVLLLCEYLRDPALYTLEDWKTYEFLVSNRLEFAESSIEDAAREGASNHILNLLIELAYAAWLYQENDAESAILALDRLIPRLEAKLEPSDPYLKGAFEIRGYALETLAGRLPQEVDQSQPWVIGLVSNQVMLRGVDYEDWFMPPCPSWAGVTRDRIPQQRRADAEYTAEIRRRRKLIDAAIAENHPAVRADASFVENWTALQAAMDESPNQGE